MFLARNGPELYVSSSTYFTWFSRLYSIHNRGAGGTGRRRPGKRAKTRYRHRQIRPISVPYDVPITVPSPNLRHRHPDKFTSSSIALSANGPFYTEVYRACVPLVNAPGLQEHVGINYRADSRNNSANLNGSGRMEAQVRRLARAFVHSLDVPLRNFSKRFDERIENGRFRGDGREGRHKGIVGVAFLRSRDLVVRRRNIAHGHKGRRTAKNISVRWRIRDKAYISSPREEAHVSYKFA